MAEPKIISNTNNPTQADADVEQLSQSADLATDSAFVADATGANRGTVPALSPTDKFLLGLGYDRNFEAMKLARAGMNASELIKANKTFMADLIAKIAFQYVHEQKSLDYMDAIVTAFTGSPIVIGSGKFDSITYLPLVSNPDYSGTHNPVEFKFGKFFEKVNLVDLEKIIWIESNEKELKALFLSESNLASAVNSIIYRLNTSMKGWKYNFILNSITNYDFEGNNIAVTLDDEIYKDSFSSLRGMVIEVLKMFVLNKTNIDKNCDVEGYVKPSDLMILVPQGFKSRIDISLFSTLFNEEAAKRGIASAISWDSIVELPMSKAVFDDNDTRITDGKVLIDEVAYLPADDTAGTASIILIEKGAFEVNVQTEYAGTQEYVYPGVTGVTLHKLGIVFGLSMLPWKKALKITGNFFNFPTDLGE